MDKLELGISPRSPRPSLPQAWAGPLTPRPSLPQAWGKEGEECANPAAEARSPVASALSTPRDPLPPDFLVVGHVTRDLVPGGWKLGGTASYASLVAARLGLRSAVLTAADAGLDLATLLPGVEIVHLDSERSMIMEHFFEGERRVQYVRETAARIRLDTAPASLRCAGSVLLGPVCGEIDPSLAATFPRSLVGATAQGWLRRVQADGRVSEGHTSDLAVDAFAGRLTALFLSEEDLGGAPVPESWRDALPILAVTRGRLGARLCIENVWWQLPAFPAREVDATGAGDAFAAAFLIRYHEIGEASEAARFAAAVASFVVEVPGITGAPSRAQAEARLQAHPELRLSRL